MKVFHWQNMWKKFVSARRKNRTLFRNGIMEKENLSVIRLEGVHGMKKSAKIKQIQKRKDTVM